MSANSPGPAPCDPEGAGDTSDPAPDGFEPAHLSTPGARFDGDHGEFVLHDASVAASDDPDGALLAFLDHAIAGRRVSPTGTPSCIAIIRAVPTGGAIRCGTADPRPIYAAHVEPFEFQFVTQTPSPPLSHLVEQLWYAHGTVPYDRERIAPTGSTVAVLVQSDPIAATPDNGAGTRITSDVGFLIGPHDSPVVNEPSGETHAVGIVTTPIGCEAVFGVPAKSLAGRVAELDVVWPPGVDIRTSLRGLAAPDALDALEERLARMVRWPTPGLERCERVAALLEADPTRPISDVAAAVGVSHSYLDRQFAQVVGLSPRRFARLLRIRRLLQRLDVHGAVDWTSIAADLGWFDQSHLIRDFKRHTGVTPRQYIAAQRSVTSAVAGVDAAGFVPERNATTRSA